MLAYSKYNSILWKYSYSCSTLFTKQHLIAAMDTIHDLDLSVTLSSDLKMTSHCNIVSLASFTQAKLILLAFHSNQPQLLCHAFNVHVRPLLEFAAPIWSLMHSLKKDILVVENVQRYFSRQACKRARLCFLNDEQRLIHFMNFSLFFIVDKCMIYVHDFRSTT